MKIKLTTMLLGIVLTAALTSCDESTKVISGDQSEWAEVGITATSSNLPAVLQGGSAEITELEGGVSTLTLTADFSDDDIAEIQERLPNYDGTSTFDADYRATSKGIQSVYDDGTSYTLVLYDAQVGDKWTMKRNGQNLVREVTQKSTEDDYYWNGWLLKTITVVETGRAVPGLQETELVFNHKFGLVGYTLKFEDGSSEAIPVVLQ